MTLTAKVTNQGGSAAGGFQIDVYKGQSTKPSVNEPGDFSCAVVSLDVGASTTCEGTVTYDTTGTNIVWAQADTTAAVPESRETNNTKHVGVVARLPDLRVLLLSVSSSSVAVGDPVTVSALVENVSSVDALNGFQIDIYKNLASSPGVGQVGDITCPVSSLASKAKTTCSGTVTYAAPGSYKLWAQVDSLNSVDETYENNNSKGPVSLTVQ